MAAVQQGCRSHKRGTYNEPQDLLPAWSLERSNDISAFHDPSCGFSASQRWIEYGASDPVLPVLASVTRALSVLERLCVLPEPQVAVVDQVRWFRAAPCCWSDVFDMVLIGTEIVMSGRGQRYSCMAKLGLMDGENEL
jgi:hypothetical protein